MKFRLAALFVLAAACSSPSNSSAQLNADACGAGSSCCAGEAKAEAKAECCAEGAAKTSTKGGDCCAEGAGAGAGCCMPQSTAKKPEPK